MDNVYLQGQFPLEWDHFPTSMLLDVVGGRQADTGGFATKWRM